MLPDSKYPSAPWRYSTLYRSSLVLSDSMWSIVLPDPVYTIYILQYIAWCSPDPPYGAVLSVISV